MHQKDICHRDLKTENIVCDKNFEDGAPVIHIADFGYAMFTKENYCTRNIQIGTRYYMAPELIRANEASEENQYDEKIDVWALGVIAYYLCREGKFPFPGKKKKVVEDGVLNNEPDWNFECDELLLKFIKKCLIKDAS